MINSNYKIYTSVKYNPDIVVSAKYLIMNKVDLNHLGLFYFFLANIEINE